MEEVANTDESLDPVREPIKGRTIIVGDWFTYRGKRYKVHRINATVGLNDAFEKVPKLDVFMEGAR